MKDLCKTSLMTFLVAGLMVFAAAAAKADSVALTTSLNFFQTVGTNVAAGALSGTPGFKSEISTLTFATTSVNIGGMVYTVDANCTIALPVPGSIGPPETGGIEGTGGAAMPEPTALLLLGTGLAGVAGLVRRKLNAGN